VSRLFDEALAPTGLKSGQFNILCAVAAGDVTTAGQVAALLAMDRTTLSRNLKPLRGAGYISSGGGAGRRPDALALTDAGQAALERVISYWKYAQIALTQRLGASPSSALLHGLEATARAADSVQLHI
jgi:DNA-binding MarR family transcriptional regulator